MRLSPRRLPLCTAVVALAALLLPACTKEEPRPVDQAGPAVREALAATDRKVAGMLITDGTVTLTFSTDARVTVLRVIPPAAEEDYGRGNYPAIPSELFPSDRVIERTKGLINTCTADTYAAELSPATPKTVMTKFTCGDNAPVNLLEDRRLEPITKSPWNQAGLTAIWSDLQELSKGDQITSVTVFEDAVEATVKTDDPPLSPCRWIWYRDLADPSRSGTVCRDDRARAEAAVPVDQLTVEDIDSAATRAITAAGITSLDRLMMKVTQTEGKTMVWVGQGGLTGEVQVP